MHTSHTTPLLSGAASCYCCSCSVWGCCCVRRLRLAFRPARTRQHQPAVNKSLRTGFNFRSASMDLLFMLLSCTHRNTSQTTVHSPMHTATSDGRVRDEGMWAGERGRIYIHHISTAECYVVARAIKIGQVKWTLAATAAIWNYLLITSAILPLFTLFRIARGMIAIYRMLAVGYAKM